MNYQRSIETLVKLLNKASEEHWVLYFTDALDLYKNGKPAASYKKVLNAYGGMASFNDLTLNFITEEELYEVVCIRSSLYAYCKSKRRGSFGLFGFNV